MKQIKKQLLCVIMATVTVFSCIVNAVAAEYSPTAYSSEDSAVTELEKPQLTAVAGNEQITLSWTAVDGAEYYEIIRYNKGSYVSVAKVSGLTATVQGLVNDFQYTYLIAAVAEGSKSSLSNPVTIAPTSVLAKPELTAVAGDKQVTLSWTAVDGAAYYQIIRYSKGAYSVVANVSGTSVTVKGLTNNFEYTYMVAAISADGRKSVSEAVNAIPADILDKTTVTAVAGDKQITLSWTAVDGAAYYQIIRYSKGAYSVVANVSGTSVTVKGLTNNFEYTYMVAAIAEDGKKSVSDSVKVTPKPALAVTKLSVKAGDKEAVLSWTSVDGADYYRVVRYNKGKYSVVANVRGTSATVKGLTNNFKYTYLIIAVADDGRTSASEAVNVTPVAALEKPVVKATVGDTEITLSWTAVDGAAYYQIIRYNKGKYTVVANVSDTIAAVKGLTNDFEYTYLVSAVAEDGRSSVSDALKVTPKLPLSAPNIVYVLAGEKQVTLYWAPVEDAAYYEVISFADNKYTVVAITESVAATIGDLTAGNGYVYLIRAVADDGRMSVSGAIQVSPKA